MSHRTRIEMCPESTHPKIYIYISEISQYYYIFFVISILGKPNPAICRTILNDGITKPLRTLMIGDNCKTDILLGKNCGFQTMLVGSGVHKLNDIQKWQNSHNADDKDFIPDTYINKLGDLLAFMQ